jgi:hypothetical protein
MPVIFKMLSVILVQNNSIQCRFLFYCQITEPVAKVVCVQFKDLINSSVAMNSRRLCMKMKNSADCSVVLGLCYMCRSALSRGVHTYVSAHVVSLCALIVGDMLVFKCDCCP